MTVLFLFFCDEICNFFGGVGILYGIKIMFLNFGASYILVVVLVVFLVFPRPSKAAFGSCISFDKKKKLSPAVGVVSCWCPGLNFVFKISSFPSLKCLRC